MNQLVVGAIMLIIWFGASLPSYLQSRRLEKHYEEKLSEAYLTGNKEQAAVYEKLWLSKRMEHK